MRVGARDQHQDLVLHAGDAGDRGEGVAAGVKAVAVGDQVVDQRAKLGVGALHQQRINDVLFEFVDAKRFRELRALAAQLVARGDRAVAMLELLIQEAEAA